jgi:hypothetical protein
VLYRCVLIFVITKAITRLSKSDCLEVVELFIDDRDHNLHAYVTYIFNIRDDLNENSNTTLQHDILKNKICVQIL